MIVISIIDYSRTKLNNIIWGLWGCEDIIRILLLTEEDYVL